MSTAPSSNRTSTASPPIAGKYRLIFELGRGGMADVMLAVIQGPGGFNKLQVLKLLRPELAAEPEFCAMFLEEARLSARINHPNVAQTNEVGFDGERYFIAMEYLEGQSLDELMRRAKARGMSLPLGLTLRCLADACGGLHFAHELKDFDGTALNVIHRDVSPQNIFVTYDGITKLLDFGIAKASDSNIRTQAGTIKGKIAYMAPEQLLGVSHIDRRADIFSLGSVLWRTITGKRMWAGASEMEILQSLANHRIPEPVPLAGMPDELVHICSKAISANPADRYPTAAVLKAELETVLKSVPASTHADVAVFVNDLLAERRKEIASAIEARLSSSSDAIPLTTTRSVPRLDPSMSSMSSTGSGLVDTAGATNYGSSPGADASGANAPPSQRHWGIIGAVVVAGGLVAAALIARPGSTPSTEPSTAPSSAPAPPSAPADRAPAKGETEVTVEVNPSSAQVFIDEVALAGKPPHATLPRDGRNHALRATADGYVTKTQDVMLDSESLRLGLSLEKVEKEHHTAPWRPGKSKGPAPSASAAPPVPSVIAPPPEPPPTTVKPPRPPGVDTIDKDDPWKK